MTPEPSQRPLSELELAALGFLWQQGPCTAYRVRRGFQESPSSHWSGSTGAIYPLLRRLEGRGLVAATADGSGVRSGKLLAVTAEGRAALRGWLDRGVGIEAASSVHDGLRTRMFFLGLLPPDAQREFVGSARSACEEHLAAIERDIAVREFRGDRFGVFAARGAWHTARARLAWLKEIAAKIAAD